MSSDFYTRFLAIASRCLHKDRRQRPTMEIVVKELQESLENETSSSDGLQGWISEHPFITLAKRGTNVGKIFYIFDLNHDDGLSRKEVAAFLFVTKHGEKQLSTCIDEVFSLYHKYIDDKKGLTYHGLLQYYEDGHSDLDSDIIVSDSDSDDSVTRKKMLWLFKTLNSIKDGSLDRKQIASRKSIYMEIVGLPFKVFNLYSKSGANRLKVDDDELDSSEVLELLLKPDDEKEAALWFSSPENLVTTKPLTIRMVLLYMLITLLVLLITTILVKLKYLWILFLILLNSIYVILNKTQGMD